ncbi:MAG TPA: HU family DNA-binding protein [Acidiferrobacterales bacterium]|nr:HU family DNA-binding protein [Acidiferrobacterales bacterium]
MNKQDISSSLICPEINKALAEAVVNHVFAEIQEAIQRGEDVRISGFGVFKRVATKARACHNPRTGEAIEVPAGYRAKFRPSSKLLEG